MHIISLTSWHLQRVAQISAIAEACMCNVQNTSGVSENSTLEAKAKARLLLGESQTKFHTFIKSWITVDGKPSMGMPLPCLCS